MKNFFLMLLTFLCCPIIALATPAESLQLLLFKFESLQAHFAETMMIQGEKQESFGTVWIQRPNQFRWQATQPTEELYISDGKELWQYEKDLSQVTVMAVNSQLAMRSPMLLLSGKVGDVAELYTVQELGVEQFLLTPKTADSLIQSIMLQFDHGILSELDITNTLSEQTAIHFTEVKINQPILPSQFQFTPPASADVLKE